MHVPADIRHLEDQLAAAERDAQALVHGLTEEQGAWRAEPGSWSVAECLDHLATANRVYLGAMKAPAVRARAQDRTRRGPALPGLIGSWFVRWLEPPVSPRLKGKAPKTIRPRTSPPLADAFAAFAKSQGEVRAFLRAYADLDLAAVRFPNPFVPVCASAWPPACTSSSPTSAVTSGRPGESARPDCRLELPTEIAD